MRLAFAGTPEFAATVLAALIAAGFPPELVLTQPDRPQGRGMRLTPSPVKRLALEHGIRVMQPATLRTEEARAPLLSLPLDVMIVAAYGLILPPAILAWPRCGCLNVHASLLPRWRGAAPIQHAVLAGDNHTGITLMQMDAGLDTGAMISREAIAIGAQDTAGDVHDALAVIGGRLAIDALRRLQKDEVLPATPQDEALATYAGKIDKTQAKIDWSQDAAAVARKIRAFNPAPAAYTLLDGEPLKIWRAQCVAAASPEMSQVASASSSASASGTVLAAHRHGIDVACGQGILRILELQIAGGKRMAADAFLSGRTLSGAVLGA